MKAIINGREWAPPAGPDCGIAFGTMQAPEIEQSAASAAPFQQVETASMAVISPQFMKTLLTGWRGEFNAGFEGAKSRYREIAMLTTSTTSEEAYGWLGQFPKLREWIGERRYKSLSTYGFTIKNRVFESTVTISRVAVEDDKIGVLTPNIREMGRAAGVHPDDLVFQLIAQGFSNPCYDGQNFFDTNHPSFDKLGQPVLASNYDNAGAVAPWFLLDTSRVIRPIIYQERIAPVFTTFSDDGDDWVFRHDEYVYGVRARSNAGYGLWQLAYASTAALTAANFEKAKLAMEAIRGDAGQNLGISPTLLVTGRSNEVAARKLFEQQNFSGGESNIWYKALDWFATPWLDS